MCVSDSQISPMHASRFERFVNYCISSVPDISNDRNEAMFSLPASVYYC